MKITLKSKVHVDIIRGEYKALISPIQIVIVLHRDMMLESVSTSLAFKLEKFHIYKIWPKKTHFYYI